MLGLPFLLVGLFVIVGPWVPGQVNAQLPRIFVSLIGLPFAAFGAWATLGRSGLEINRKTRTVKTWWGLLVPLRSKEFRLSKYKRVVLSESVRGGRGGSRSRIYAVRLAGRRGMLPVEELGPYKRAR